MKKNIKNISVILVGLMLFIITTSFASIINGTEQAVSFDSDIDQVEVYIDGQFFGKTPLTVNLKKNKYSTVIFKKEGYTSQVLPLKKSFDGVALLNIFWDLSTTDMINGAVYEYEPNRIFVTLSKDINK